MTDGGTYGRNGLNQIASMEQSDYVGSGDEEGLLELEHVYDGQGRRVRKLVYQKIPQADGSVVKELVKDTLFIYDGWNPAYEKESKRVFENGSYVRTETTERHYIWGPDVTGSLRGAGGVGGLLAVVEDGRGSAKHSYPVYDPQGSVIALVDAGGKGVVAEYNYGPYGEPMWADGARAGSNPFRYSTKYTDSETGLLYYGYRYYNPQDGTWLSRDPLGEAGGLNLYGFVNNDPVNGIDYLGLVDYRVKKDAIPVLVYEGDGRWGVYLQTMKKSAIFRTNGSSYSASRMPGYYAEIWVDSPPIKVATFSDEGAARFINGEATGLGADWINVANLRFEAEAWQQSAETFKTFGQIIPGVGTGVALAEGERIKGGAYFTRDVLLTITGTKFIQGGKSIGSFILRGAAVGSLQGGSSAAFDVTGSRLQAFWDGKEYEGTLSGDAWNIVRATRNGAVFGAALGPLARLKQLSTLPKNSGHKFSDGLGGSRSLRNEVELTADQQKQLYQHVDELGLDADDFLISSHMSSYSPMVDKVFLGPNTFPLANGGGGVGTVFGRLSPRSVVAHEAGHMIADRAGKGFAGGSLLDEVQASLLGRSLRGLNRIERYQLLRDAAERARKEGVKLRSILPQLNY